MTKENEQTKPKTEVKSKTISASYLSVPTGVPFNGVICHEFFTGKQEGVSACVSIELIDNTYWELIGVNGDELCIHTSNHRYFKKQK